VWGRALGLLGGVLGGLFGTGTAKAVDLPADRAEGMYHVYQGGGVTATGPALLVRKSLLDKVSLSGSYYVDAVSNASIDVVTTASPFKENRTAYELGLDYAYRDALVSLSTSSSTEPDYTANAVGIDVSQEVFGGMTTVALGYTRAVDKVSKKGAPEFKDSAKHWQYRVGVTQILSPRLLGSANLEVVSDDGYLGSPYRVARVFGAAVPERNPRTRTSRAIKLRLIGDLGQRNAARGEYRYFFDTWDVKAHTAEVGYSRYIGENWLADGFVRVHSQSAALFYADNASVETAYLTRNRQLSAFRSLGIGGKLSYLAKKVPGRYEVKLNGAIERVRFDYSDFTDLRSGGNYRFDANLFQVYVTATY